MRRHSKAVRKQRRKTVTRKRRNVPKKVGGRSSSAASRETEVARLSRELNEALERQTAASEILRIIASSTGDVDTVFEAILEKATRICEAKFGVLLRYQDGAFEARAMVGAPPALAREMRRRALFVSPKGAPLDRLSRTKKAIYTVDATKEQVQPPSVKLGGARSHIAVPMLKNNELIGAITIFRQEVRPFTDKQVELVEQFAAQAVIAIENTRLLKGLRQRTDDLTESLEQQTATSEVLQVISSSTGDLQPVFNAVLENATRLCAAKFGNLYLCEGDAFRTTAMYNVPPEFAEVRRREPLIRPSGGSALLRMAEFEAGGAHSGCEAGARLYRASASVCHCRRARRVPGHGPGTDAEGRQPDWRHHYLPAGGRPLLRQAD